MMRGMVSLAFQLRRCGTNPPPNYLSASRNFHTNGEAQDKTIESAENLKVFVFDTETTGLSKCRNRIIELAIKDLSGGPNSSFQTLVNPQQLVTNSEIHGITTQMVNRPDIPRAKEAFSILEQYVDSRLKPEDVALFVVHNAKLFDVPFLKHEFSRCSMEIPSHWNFFDSLPLARQYKKAKGLNSLVCKLSALCEYFDIPVKDPLHRAMADVDALTYILSKLKFEMKLTNADLYKQSFKATDVIKSPKKKVITNVVCSQGLRV